MTPAPFRLLRTTLVGSTVLGLAAGAHVVAGGTLPLWPIMLAILALHIMCSTIVTKFQLTLPVMLALLGSSQIVLHKAFEFLSHGMHAAEPAGSATSLALSHHAMSAEAHASAMLAQAAATGTPDVDSLATLSHTGAISGWMMVAHIVATLAAAALLAHGESALWSLAHWLRPLFRCAAVVLIVPVKSTGIGVIPRPLPRLPWRNLRPDTRRGPPFRTAIFA